MNGVLFYEYGIWPRRRGIQSLLVFIRILSPPPPKPFQNSPPPLPQSLPPSSPSPGVEIGHLAKLQRSVNKERSLQCVDARLQREENLGHALLYMLKVLTGRGVWAGLKKDLDVIGSYTWEGKEGHRAHFGPPPLCASHFKDSICACMGEWSDSASGGSGSSSVYTRYGLRSYYADTLRPPDFLMSGPDGSKPNVRKDKRVKSWTIKYTETEGFKNPAQMAPDPISKLGIKALTYSILNACCIQRVPWRTWRSRAEVSRKFESNWTIVHAIHFT